jgi:hypothetical protein
MGQIAVDFIGRQEHLEADFAMLCEQMGVSAQLNHLNRSPGSDRQTTTMCSGASRKRIREVYARDYELFAYD